MEFGLDMSHVTLIELDIGHLDGNGLLAAVIDVVATHQHLFCVQVGSTTLIEWEDVVGLVISAESVTTASRRWT